jgi:membrane associated rhomboid family serine protease
MNKIVGELRTQVLILATLVSLMWVLEGLDTFIFQRGLDTLGILPRQPIGLRGILFAPFLHGGFGHLSANTAPFIVLGWLVMVRRITDFVAVSAIVMLVGGLGTWIFGAPGMHIGASGVIFGYLGFLLARCYFDRRLSSGIIALFVGCTYGTILWGVLPTMPGVSWEGHLFGFIGGIISAAVVKSVDRG